MGQKTSKTTANEFDAVVPHPSGRAETSLDQQSVQIIKQAPSKSLTIPDKESVELNEELIKVIRDMDGVTSSLTLAQFQEKISHLDFTEQFEENSETANTITAEEYENVLKKVSGLLEQGATALPIDEEAESSALFECILRDKLAILSLILSVRRQDLHQKCNGLTMLESTVVYRRWDLFTYLVTNFNDEINTATSGTLAALVKMSTEFGWTEELFGKWFTGIKNDIEDVDFDSLQALTGPQFDVALELYPLMMEEIRLLDPNSSIAPHDMV